MIEEVLSDIEPSHKEKKIALEMIQGKGYSTASEIHFDSEHPFQLVDAGEVFELLATGRFRVATPEEIKDYYQIAL